MDKSQTEVLVARERALISDLDVERRPWTSRRYSRGGTVSHESFVYALSMPEASIALAMLRAYASTVGLDNTDQWSVSAMPSWRGATDVQRFATISSANIEHFYVWFESRTGEITEWGIRVPAVLGDKIPVTAELWRDEARNGDASVHGKTLRSLLDLLDNPDVPTVLVAAFRRRKGPRRRDWHNPYLGALLGVKIQEHSSDEQAREVPTEPETPEDIEFERRYIERVTKHRLHQSPLREAALRAYGARCMYCGLDIEEILEAAHVIPDSEGGAASVANIRILCANHHTALDAGLLTVTAGGQVVAVPGAPTVLPRPLESGDDA